MAEAITCQLCATRRAKRWCPAVHGNICTICCGEQREVTLTCPLDCEFLRAAHKHEKTIEVSIAEIASPEVEISEDFIRAHEAMLLFFVYSLVQAALRTAHAVDSDVLDALAALIKTQRSAQAGLVYEARPENQVAAAIQRSFSKSLEEYENQRSEQEPFARRADGDIFKLIIFLHRIGQQNRNGRPKGRMFIDMMRNMTPDTRVDERAPSIIL